MVPPRVQKGAELDLSLACSSPSSTPFLLWERVVLGSQGFSLIKLHLSALHLSKVSDICPDPVHLWTLCERGVTEMLLRTRMGHITLLLLVLH
jgi:hypothetical protein